MAKFGNMKNLAATPSVTIASAAALPIPDGDDNFFVTGTTNISTILASPRPGRTIRLQKNDAAGNLTLTHNGVPAEGTLSLGANITFGQNDVITLQQQTDKSWLRLSNADN